MDTKNTGRITLIVFVLAVGLLCIVWPPQRLFDFGRPWSAKHNLKPGIDISGGTSLLYEIKPPPGGATDNLSQQVADALKRRVDPDGVRNLIWRPQGPHLLEIQMPLSEGADKADAARKAYQIAQNALEQTNVRPGVVQTSLQAAVKMTDPAAMQKVLESLAKGSPERLTLYRKLVDLYQQLAKAQETKIVERIVDLKDEIRAAEKEIEESNLPVQRLSSELELFQSAIDDATRRGRQKVVAEKLAERQKKIDKFKSQHPGWSDRQAAIDEFVRTYDAYADVKNKVADAEGLKRLLRGAGLLEFHILVTDQALFDSMAKRLLEEGPTPKANDVARWYEVDQPQEFTHHRTVEYGGKTWALAYTTPDKSMVHSADKSKDWGLSRATRDTDPQKMRPIVSFQFDSMGAVLFGDLTGRNVQTPLAIVLDQKLISAPNINERIGGSGQISGDFSDDDIDYLVRTLNAGSLPAQLADQPLMERTVSPTLGKDNLMRGFVASIVGLVVTAAFLIGYYFLTGVVATIAVLINLVLILGAMAAFNATFTLPGIAALVLTVGMAVDANVLIFERLREEQHRGLSLRMAMRNAYDRAWSAILDSNVTTAITSLLLWWLGSEEVKGFGLTLLIGMCSSLFTALFVTRTIFDIMIDQFGIKRLGSLPLSFPNWDKMLRPNIDWMSKAWIFSTFSTVMILVGLSAFIFKGKQMFDTEFVGGTTVEVRLKRDVALEDMRKLLAPYDKENELPSAQVVSIGNSQREYEIVTPHEKANVVKNIIMKALEDVLAVELPSRFEIPGKGEYTAAMSAKLIQPVVYSGEVGSRAIRLEGLDWLPQSAEEFEGGVAVILKGIDPPLRPSEITDRVNRARLRDNKPYRKLAVEGPGGDQPTATAVVLASDQSLRWDAESIDKQAAWREGMASDLWESVKTAVAEPPPLQKVTNFSPQVAQATLKDAIIALVLSVVFIMVYIWLRFGNLKFGSATVLALLHDALFTIGAIGISHYVANTALGSFLMIDAFRMNLTLVAAVLTVIGYSMNDTVVVFDRIRENRGKFGHVDRQIINDSINQTLSRTLLTGGTTIVTVAVMYVYGGPGIHGFTFALLIGILVGTYSSIAIASPILLLGRKDLVATTATGRVPVAGRVPQA